VKSKTVTKAAALRGAAGKSPRVWSFDPRPMIVAVATILLLGAGACGSSDYVRTQQAWTRSEKVYENFETRAIVRATLKSNEFRRAWIDEYARVFALGAEQKSALAEADARCLSDGFDPAVFRRVR
jgi:hypothetical protein